MPPKSTAGTPKGAPSRQGTGSASTPSASPKRPSESTAPKAQAKVEPQPKASSLSPEAQELAKSFTADLVDRVINSPSSSPKTVLGGESAGAQPRAEEPCAEPAEKTLNLGQEGRILPGSSLEDSTQETQEASKVDYEDVQKQKDEQHGLDPLAEASTFSMAATGTGSVGEDEPLLASAYHQISVLNSQLAHLYAELTLARTEAQSLRAEAQQRSGVVNVEQDAQALAAAVAENQAQSHKIADLVSDIRHLQLDLEYHQQKLDQSESDKAQLMKDLKVCQDELAQARKILEERDQMVRHKEVDISYLKQELKSYQNVNVSGGGLKHSPSDDGILVALRSEAAAKDSALIVSHYALHKEKLLKDRLEQKNIKLMERMHMLMMVVENMRRDNVALERTLAAKDKLCDEKEARLRSLSAQARQLQRVAREKAVARSAAGNQSHRSSSRKAAPVLLEMESHSEVLPPLNSHRRANSAGRRNGNSPMRPPRTPKAAPSPHGMRTH